MTTTSARRRCARPPGLQSSRTSRPARTCWRRPAASAARHATWRQSAAPGSSPPTSRAPNSRIAAEWTRNAEGAERIRYEYADYHALPFADASFDVYWCQDSLLFSTDKPRALAEAARVVRPGGTIAISDLVVTGRPAPDAAVLLTEISAPGFWSAEDYRKGLVAAGFEGIAVEDWSRHVLPSFDLLTADIAARRTQLAAIASEADVAETLERYALWCKASRTGNLGWSALVGTKRPRP